MLLTAVVGGLVPNQAPGVKAVQAFASLLLIFVVGGAGAGSGDGAGSEYGFWPE